MYYHVIPVNVVIDRLRTHDEKDATSEHHFTYQQRYLNRRFNLNPFLQTIYIFERRLAEYGIV